VGYRWKLLKVYAATILASDGLNLVGHIHTSKLIPVLPPNNI